MYFAAITGLELSQILGAFGILLAGFYGFSYKMMRDSRVERTDERKAFMATVETLAKNIEENSRNVAENTRLTKLTADSQQEFKDFMISLNGSLKKVVKEKQGE